jgi:hypothetical protein
MCLRYSEPRASVYFGIHCVLTIHAAQFRVDFLAIVTPPNPPHSPTILIQFNPELKDWRRQSVQSNTTMHKASKCLSQFIIHASFLYSWLSKPQFSAGKIIVTSSINSNIN